MSLKHAELLMNSPKPSQSTVPEKAKQNFNARLFWPDIIRLPENQWTFTCKEIIDKLNASPDSGEMKKLMEKCLMYFYSLKKTLTLFDHTYTASSILLFRFWYIYGLPPNLMTCLNISQAILVTACKATENNRPLEAYVKATADFMFQVLPHLKAKYNMDKLKWEVRDKVVEYEKRVVCSFGFDLNIENPKGIIEEMFSGFYRFNRDYDLPDDFKACFPKILQESRSFIVQAITQPVSLLFDGPTFVILSLIYCGLQYKQMVDKDFRYPKNFFLDRFDVHVKAEDFQNYFTDYRVLEENFFDLKSNKGNKLLIGKDEIAAIIEETAPEVDTEEKEKEEFNYKYYNSIRSGKVQEQLLDHTELRVRELKDRIIEESKKRSSSRESGKTSPSGTSEPPQKRAKI
ncbi:Bur2p KNAG_0A02540 [Huiozyma naganishii CBS 8797]|uniref:Cyclin N-terminal domain-containing protein n=1 Tax=Huiozyma naganishii (strain ATCC MYA-139 / BCRC 22969 / CBS 8797 / KCTC 17520 / NBRC 10181 / NCYC 3082 / Yp74L-3) TaxID=1071383 RepID=J7REF7_HUIN7|nr:hypothetical protein KNAG_0A02540 [Kazachstania naganishii CBS 8797]CCK67943.1 hypothetical protein KNAG_0A02540 [Kazachstania naganishii CBS 8797]